MVAWSNCWPHEWKLIEKEGKMLSASAYHLLLNAVNANQAFDKSSKKISKTQWCTSQDTKAHTATVFTRRHVIFQCLCLLAIEKWCEDAAVVVAVAVAANRASLLRGTTCTRQSEVNWKSKECCTVNDDDDESKKEKRRSALSSESSQ